MKKLRVGQSFSVDEVEFMDRLFKQLWRNGDVTQMSRSPVATAIARKVQAMRGSFDRQRAAAVNGDGQQGEIPEPEAVLPRELGVQTHDPVRGLRASSASAIRS